MVAAGQIRVPLALGRRQKWQIGEKSRWQLDEKLRCRPSQRSAMWQQGWDPTSSLGSHHKCRFLKYLSLLVVCDRSMRMPPGATDVGVREDYELRDGASPSALERCTISALPVSGDDARWSGLGIADPWGVLFGHSWAGSLSLIAAGPATGRAGQGPGGSPAGVAGAVRRPWRGRPVADHCQAAGQGAVVRRCGQRFRAGAFLCGWPAVAAGAGGRSSQPYLGPRGLALPRRQDDWLGVPGLRGCGRSV